MSKRKKQTRKSIFGDKFATPTVVVVPEKKPETKQDDGFAISEGIKEATMNGSYLNLFNQASLMLEMQTQMNNLQQNFHMFNPTQQLEVCFMIADLREQIKGISTL